DRKRQKSAGKARACSDDEEPGVTFTRPGAEASLLWNVHGMSPLGSPRRGIIFVMMPLNNAQAATVRELDRPSGRRSVRSPAAPPRVSDPSDRARLHPHGLDSR